VAAVAPPDRSHSGSAAAAEAPPAASATTAKTVRPFRRDHLLRCDAFGDPAIQSTDNIVIGIRELTFYRARPEAIEAGPVLTMVHARNHEKANEALRI
jgi:hypothetical protein